VQWRSCAKNGSREMRETNACRSLQYRSAHDHNCQAQYVFIQAHETPSERQNSLKMCLTMRIEADEFSMHYMGGDSGLGEEVIEGVSCQQQSGRSNRRITAIYEHLADINGPACPSFRPRGERCA
jgi:hypothetical protein